MRSNQPFSFTKRFTHVKVPMPDLFGLKELKQLMTPQQHHDFVCTYGKILNLDMIEEWVYFMSILALLIYGVILFPSMIDWIDQVAVNVFLAYYY